MRFLLLVLLMALTASAYASKSTGFNCKCVDIIFVLDMSGSISETEWRGILDYVCHFMACFKNPPNDVHFAVVKFDTNPSLIFNLDDKCNNNGTCKSLLDDCPRWTGGGTYLGKSLQLVVDKVIHSAGDRDHVRCPNLIIVLTDGYYTDQSSAIQVANQLKEHYHTSIAAIGVGRSGFSGLNAIASDKDFVFQAYTIPFLLKLVDDLKVVACDTIHYDPACQTCCCGEIHGDKKRQYPDWKNKCCGKVRYNAKRATCCQGRLWEGFDEAWTRCCYDEAYDPRDSTCCFNRVVHATRSQDQCCGFTAYNQKHEICCRGRVYRKLKHTQCCGGVAYNPKWEICCRYQVREGCSARFRCCGSRSYNPKREVCVNPYYSYVRPSPVIYCGQDISLYCGYKNYWDPLWNTCCAGKVHPGAVTHRTGCCRHERYDLHNELCCDGVKHSVDPSWYRCCGRSFYDPWDQTCCQGYYVVNGKGLCCGYYRVFDHKNQICCGGYYVYNGRPSHTKCCYSYYFGYRPYNIKTELCCYGYVRPGGKHYRCCGYYSYNIKTHMCCFGYIYSRRVFRLLQWCDNPFQYDELPDNPIASLDEGDSVNEPEPSGEERAPPVIEDDPEDANGINADNDPDNQPVTDDQAAGSGSGA